ncbi:MAG: hypothetical protein AMXMBFR25_15290 [Lysobacterales bacterium]
MLQLSRVAVVHKVPQGSGLVRCLSDPRTEEKPMTLSPLLLAAVGGLALSSAHAQTPVPAAGEAEPCHQMHCVVARRGTAEVTVADILAKSRTLDERQRGAVLSDPRNLNQMVENILIMRQIANAADQDKAAADPVVQASMALARDEVIGLYQLDHIRATRVQGDFERLARENYQANKDAFKSPREVRVRHLLIASSKRSDAEALALAEKLAAELQGADDERFASAVMEHSDDPSKSNNGGIYNVPENSSEFDPQFLQGAISLTVKGQLSKPIKTAFGYHLIRLLDQRASVPVPFEEVHSMILDKVKQEARRKAVMEYRAELSTAELEFFPRNLEKLMSEAGAREPAAK